MQASHDVVVTNTGKVVGDCVVTAFVLATPTSPVDFPLKKLFGFERLKQMAPNESRTVHFTSDATTLSVVDEAGRRMLVAGEYAVEVGDVLTPAVGAIQLEGDSLLIDDNAWALGLLQQP